MKLSSSFYWAVVAMAIVASSASAQQRQINVAEIDRIARTQVDSGFNGVVLVASHDTVLLNRAYSLHGKLTPSSTFWIASMTKGFTAAAILRLQSYKRLSVRDSIGRFFRDAPSDKKGITIHQLLTHTSGLGGEYSGGGITDRSEAIRAILAHDLLFAPGKSYKYGDDDYELLAAIVEASSGNTWETYVRRHLLQPLHLDHTGFACDQRRSSPVKSTVSDHPAVTCDWGRKGANGMFSTARDLLTWSRALSVPGRLQAASEISRPQVFVRKEPPYDISYGYGVRVYTLNGAEVEIMHSGSGDDDNTSIVRNMKSGLTVIVLSNAGQHNGTTWASYVARKLATRETS